MHVEILQENLIKVLSLVNRFVPNKASMPILSNLLIEADDNSLRIQATNMETAITCQVPAKVEKKGRAVVPAKLIYEYVNVLGPGKTTLVLEESSLLVKRDTNQAKLNILEEKSFPDFPENTYDQELSLPQSLLQEISQLVLFAASTEESRPVLASVLLEFDPGEGLKVVATDGYRLSLLTISNSSLSFDQELRLLVPAKTLLEIFRLCKDLKVETVNLSFSQTEQSIQFLLDSTMVISRLIDGDYPHYQKILPESESITVKVNRLELIEALKAASLFARSNSNIVKFQLDKTQLSISAQASQVGQQTSQLLVQNSSSESMTIAFNGRYVLDVLAHLSNEMVNIGINAQLQPVQVYEDKSTFVHIIMPVRTQSD